MSAKTLATSTSTGGSSLFETRARPARLVCAAAYVRVRAADEGAQNLETATGAARQPVPAGAVTDRSLCAECGARDGRGMVSTRAERAKALCTARHQGE